VRLGRKHIKIMIRPFPFTGMQGSFVIHRHAIKSFEMWLSLNICGKVKGKVVPGLN
jgi:hypothetical protein